MRTFPLKILAGFMLMISLSVLIAVVMPATAEHMNPKLQIVVSAISVFFSGVGFLLCKRWAVYIYFLGMVATMGLNVFIAGHVGIGNAWIGWLTVGGLSLIYWRELQ